jgi:hypothetical protein
MRTASKEIPPTKKHCHYPACACMTEATRGAAALGKHGLSDTAANLLLDAMGPRFFRETPCNRFPAVVASS